MREGRLIAPHEVFVELQKRDDGLAEWAKQMKAFFVDLDDEQRVVLEEILRRFPALADAQSENAHADPIVVSLAVLKSRQHEDPGLFQDAPTRWIVVTEEIAKGPGSLKIPDVCAALGVDAINILTLMTETT